MKILFVTNYPSPYRVEFFNELGKYCDVTVAFEEDVKEQKHRDSNWFNCNYSNFNAVFLTKTKVKNKFICLDVKKYVCDKKYDIVVITNYSTLTEMYAIYCMKRKNIRFAIEIDGGMAKSGNGIVEKIKKGLISSASWWFSTSEPADEYLITYGAKKEKIFRYPFTSLMEKDILISPLDSNHKLNLKKKLNMNEKKVIITIGQFIHRKGFDILIKAMKDLPSEYGVYIIGGSPTEEYLKLKEELALRNLHFEGFKNKEQLKEYYMAADLFVLPTREDIWGLVINEAMAYGLPVVTTDKCVAGIELIENDINGKIVEVENENLLAEAIKHILSKEDLISIIATNNLKKINGYTIESMARVHKQIFHKILDL